MAHREIKMRVGTEQLDIGLQQVARFICVRGYSQRHPLCCGRAGMPRIRLACGEQPSSIVQTWVAEYAALSIASAFQAEHCRQAGGVAGEIEHVAIHHQVSEATL